MKKTLNKKDKYKKIKLHFGCGEEYLKEYINCDISKNVRSDINFNMEVFPYPFEDNYAEEILMNMILEHLDDIVKVMEEIYRILKDKGVVKIYVPYAKGDWSFQDPTHKHFFTERSMDYFTDQYKYNFYTNVRFSLEKNELYTSTDTRLSRLRNLIPFRNLLKNFLFNMYDGVYFELMAIK
jgi:predicted SAM-dependent methyltransferase